MRLLAFTGSVLLVIYLLVLVAFTAVNVSKLLFQLKHPEQHYDFWARQTTIFLWPLIIISEEVRTALTIIWEGEEL